MSDTESTGAQVMRLADGRDLRTFPSIPMPLGPAVHHPITSGLDELFDFATDVGARVVYHQEIDPTCTAVVVMAGQVAHVAFDTELGEPGQVIAALQGLSGYHLGIEFDDFDEGPSEDENERAWPSRKSGPIDADDLAAFAEAGHDRRSMDFEVASRWHKYINSPEVRRYTSIVVADDRYSPSRHGFRLTGDELAELLGTDDQAIHAAVYDGAREVYEREVLPDLTKQAREHARTIVAHPLWRWDVFAGAAGRFLVEMIDEALELVGIHDVDPRVRQEVSGQLFLLHNSHKSSADVYVETTARKIWNQLDADEQDAVAFDSRVAATEQRVRHLLPDDEMQVTRQVLVSAIRSLAAENQVEREMRYATAGRALMGSGASKAAAGRTLGLAPARLDRIVAENPKDVTIAEDDHLFQVLPR